MKSNLLLATRNPKKKQELQEILNDLGIQVVTLDEFPALPEVEEDGNSFAENAVKKAVTTALASGLPCLADDSGLLVDALDGQPGIYSARFAGENANDQQNNEKLLSMMQNVDNQQRTARFVCVIALSDTQGNTRTVEGSCAGKIAFAPQGDGGFGYDPLFIPTGYERSFAELRPEEKNLISHRGRALEKVRPIIVEFFSRE